MSTSTTDLIRKIDFFEPLDEKIIRKIAEVCIPREYSKGDAIVKQGESGLGLFFITAGKVQVEVEKNGAKSIVAQLKEEDFLGELSIIDNKPRSASVLCLEDTTCLLLTRDSFSRLMNKYPEIAVQMAKALAGRIRASNEKMAQQGGVAVKEGSPAAAPAAAAPSNGGSAASVAAAQEQKPAAPSGPSTKDQVKEFLIETFSFLYTMKALTRFSAAIVGCPVTVEPSGMPGGECAVEEMGGVKFAVFPAAADAALNLDAWADGSITATVFRPGVANAGPDIVSLGGCVLRDDMLELRIPARGEIRLDRRIGR